MNFIVIFLREYEDVQHISQHKDEAHAIRYSILHHFELGRKALPQNFVLCLIRQPQTLQDF